LTNRVMAPYFVIVHGFYRHNARGKALSRLDGEGDHCSRDRHGNDQSGGGSWSRPREVGSFDLELKFSALNPCGKLCKTLYRYNFCSIQEEQIMKTTSSPTKMVTLARWVARILGTLIVVFSLFSFIADVIKQGEMPNLDFGHGLVTFLYNIALIGFLIAWRWEGLGGILSAIGILLMATVNVVWVHAGKDPGSEIIFLIPALLFIYCWWGTRKQLQQNSQDG